MKKKAESRLRPFFQAELSEEKLNKMIQALSPTDLGEIKNLIGVKITEMEGEFLDLRKRLELAECPSKIMEERLSDGKKTIAAVAAIKTKFEHVFQERKQKKQEILS